MSDLPGADRRQRIISKARDWLGTPYHHCADIPGIGVDCAMLVLRVYQAAGCLPDFDPRPYPPDWHLHREDERFLAWVQRFASPIGEDGAPQTGDVVVWRVGRAYSHAGIVSTWSPSCQSVVHAYAKAGRVLREDWRETDLVRRPWRAFTVFPG